MFTCGLAETTAQTVELKETPLKPFKLTLEYIYSGKLKKVTGPEDLASLLAIADRYQLDTLAKAVAEYMAGSISKESVVLYLVNARAYNKQFLEDACLAFLDGQNYFTLIAGWELVDEVRATDSLL
jgi:hypothetical protein